jgi:hypothetical protein
MRDVLWLFAIVLGLASVNAAIGRRRECGCSPECWCRKPMMRHIRWVVPSGLHAVRPELESELHTSSQL